MPPASVGRLPEDAAGFPELPAKPVIAPGLIAATRKVQHVMAGHLQAVPLTLPAVTR